MQKIDGFDREIAAIYKLDLFYPAECIVSRYKISLLFEVPIPQGHSRNFPPEISTTLTRIFSNFCRNLS